MSRFLLDSNCLIALFSAGHAHHHATRDDADRRRRKGEEFVVAVPCALECYAVLTRLPKAHRMAADETWAALERNLEGRLRVGLSAEEAWCELRDAASNGITGGQVYDAIIAACARKASATLVTWNLRHFMRYAGKLEIVNPLGERA